LIILKIELSGSSELITLITELLVETENTMNLWKRVVPCRFAPRWRGAFLLGKVRLIFIEFCS